MIGFGSRQSSRESVNSNTDKQSTKSLKSQLSNGSRNSSNTRPSNHNQSNIKNNVTTSKQSSKQPSCEISFSSSKSGVNKNAINELKQTQQLNHALMVRQNLKQAQYVGRTSKMVYNGSEGESIPHTPNSKVKGNLSIDSNSNSSSAGKSKKSDKSKASSIEVKNRVKESMKKYVQRVTKNNDKIKNIIKFKANNGSFTDTTLTKESTINSNLQSLNIIDRAKSFQKAKQDKIDFITSLQENEYTQACTFHPNITRKMSVESLHSDGGSSTRRIITPTKNISKLKKAYNNSYSFNHQIEKKIKEDLYKKISHKIQIQGLDKKDTYGNRNDTVRSTVGSGSNTFNSLASEDEMLNRLQRPFSGRNNHVNIRDTH